MNQKDEQPVFCPSCGARYTARPGHVERGLLVLCGICGGVNEAALALSAPLHQEAQPEAILEASWPRVVVGHEQPAACRTLAAVLRRGGYSPICVRSGDMLLQACDPSMPVTASAVVVDVAIPGVMAFEVIEQLRAVPSLASIPVVLLASVFERTRYKRRPSSLYGADAYLELHHVPDRLCEILDAVRGGRSPGRDRHQAPSDRAEAAPLRARIDPVSEEALRAYARRLLSDVALYHGQEIAGGIRGGAPLGGLQDAIDEARARFVADTQAPERVALFDEEVESFGRRLIERGGHGPRADA